MGGGARRRALCPVPDRYKFGRVATQFQKLVVSGTFHLRNGSLIAGVCRSGDQSTATRSRFRSPPHRNGRSGSPIRRCRQVGLRAENRRGDAVGGSDHHDVCVASFPHARPRRAVVFRKAPPWSRTRLCPLDAGCIVLVYAWSAENTSMTDLRGTLQGGKKRRHNENLQGGTGFGSAHSPPDARGRWLPQPCTLPTCRTAGTARRNRLASSDELHETGMERCTA